MGLMKEDTRSPGNSSNGQQIRHGTLTQKKVVVLLCQGLGCFFSVGGFLIYQFGGFYSKP